MINKNNVGFFSIESGIVISNELKLHAIEWWWTYSEFYDGPFDTRQEAFLDCQVFVECELDEMTEVNDEC